MSPAISSWVTTAPMEDRDIEVIGNIPALPDLLEQNGVAPDKVADLVTTVNHSDPAQSYLCRRGWASSFWPAKLSTSNNLWATGCGPDGFILLRDAPLHWEWPTGTIDIDRLPPYDDDPSWGSGGTEGRVWWPWKVFSSRARGR